MNEHQQELKKLETELLNFERASSKLYHRLRRLRKTGKLQVTDHAVLRYMERIQGIDVDAVRQSILTPQLVSTYEVLGNGEFPIRDDSVRAVIENGVVVTVYP